MAWRITFTANFQNGIAFQVENASDATEETVEEEEDEEPAKAHMATGSYRYGCDEPAGNHLGFTLPSTEWY